MKIILYVYAYIIGVVVGSFLTLAIHRIPKKQDITHTRSYCPKCNHRLNFLDLIPILSYIFLGGKCRYCHEKIRPRYFIIEATSGIVFLLFVASLNIDLLNIEIKKIAILIFGMLFIAVIYMIVGIFKEYKRIEKGVLTFGFISEIMYMTYLYIFNCSINIYRYIICLLFILISMVLNEKAKKDIIRKILFIIFLAIGLVNIIV